MNYIHLKLMKKSVYASLRNNYKKVYEYVLMHPEDSGWLSEFVPEGENPYEEIKYSTPDFSLDYSDNYYEYACSNAIKLYEAFCNLPAHILYNRYFWAWVIFEKAYKQTIQAFELVSAKTLLNTWLPESNDRRHILRSAIAREFIKVKYSVKEDSDDPYELTCYFMNNRPLYEQMRYRMVSDLPTVTHAVLNIEKELRDNTRLRLTQNFSNSVMMWACQIGSVRLIDTMTENEIETILRKKFNDQYPGILNS